MADLFGSSEAGKKGGIARARKLTRQQRSEQASLAAEARWGTDLPIAAYGDTDHPLIISDGKNRMEITCYVLDDGRRVLLQAGMLKSLNMRQGTAGRGYGDRLVRFINTKGINSFVSKELTDVITKPIRFRTPSGGSAAYGYEATVLADLCDAVLEARKNGSLHFQQEHIATQCEILVRGFARVGIIALVDEATGYQRARARDDLAKILEAFVAKELQKWIRTFPLEFYELICEVRGEPLSRAYKRPAYFGQITNNLIYERLAPGVLEELRQKNPVLGKGKRRHKHFQFLTTEVGHPKLKEHLAGVVSVLRVAKLQSIGWKPFLKLVNKTHPKYLHMPLFDQSRDDASS